VIVRWGFEEPILSRALHELKAEVGIIVVIDVIYTEVWTRIREKAELSSGGV
jgi:hypothetical protein